MPQLNLIRIASADVATNGSDAVLDAGPAFRHIPDRLLVAGINLIPRWTT